ncbi:MAG: polysaccharide biosynthesis protein [Evtepia sp.]
MSKSTQHKSTFFGGAAILAVGIAIVKVIGALYKIPLGRMLDDIGFGHFNNAYAIYNLLLMISTAGLPVALSKTISEADALGRRNQVRRVFSVALITFLALGTISCLIMFIYAKPLALWQGDGLAAPAVRTMALSCFFVCAISAFRGYAQGHGDMIPTAISQIVEALTKLIVGLGLAFYLLQMGFDSSIAAAGAIGGVTVSGLVALIFLIVLHSRNASREKGLDRADPPGHILSDLAKIAIPITLSASVVPITTYLDTVQVQTRLQDALGYSESMAVGMYGCYQKAVTIYNLPSSFMVALTACIIPAIAACIAKRDSHGAGQISESALRMGSLLACPAGIGLAVLSGPIIYLIYPETDQAVGSACLLTLGIASIFVCMMLLCNSILQAGNHAGLPIWFIAIGSATKLGINYVLVGLPQFGIIGAPIGTLVCFVMVSVMELIAIKKVIPCPPSYRRVFVKPLFASLVMGGAVWAANGFFTGLIGPNFAAILAILVGCGVYLVMILALRILSKEDLALMPKGDKIAKILHIHD